MVKDNVLRKAMEFEDKINLLQIPWRMGVLGGEWSEQLWRTDPLQSWCRCGCRRWVTWWSSLWDRQGSEEAYWQYWHVCTSHRCRMVTQGWRCPHLAWAPKHCWTCDRCRAKPWWWESLKLCAHSRTWERKKRGLKRKIGGVLLVSTW